MKWRLVRDVKRLARLEALVDLRAILAGFIRVFVELAKRNVRPLTERHDALMYQRDTNVCVVFGNIPCHSGAAVNQAKVDEGNGFVDFTAERVTGHAVGYQSGRKW